MKRKLSRRDLIKASGVAGGLAQVLPAAGFAVAAAEDAPQAGPGPRIIMQYPSNLWREALVAGNGKFGAAVYGSIHLERILFNHEDLWDYAEATGQPDVGSLLPQARRLLQQGKRWEANDLYTDKLRDLGYRVKLGALLPLADLLVS